MALQSVHKDYTLAPRASGRLSWLETLLVTAAALGWASGWCRKIP